MGRRRGDHTGRRFKSGRPDQKTQVREVPDFQSGASFDLREPPTLSGSRPAWGLAVGLPPR